MPSVHDSELPKSRVSKPSQPFRRLPLRAFRETSHPHTKSQRCVGFRIASNNKANASSEDKNHMFPHRCEQMPQRAAQRNGECVMDDPWNRREPLSFAHVACAPLWGLFVRVLLARICRFLCGL